ncbi:MAG: hydrogenase formation protein HypD [Dehalococcoidia bacterium]|nr:hydrogenase formation protein HypD [Dehalococcoidia bacterium]
MPLADEFTNSVLALKLVEHIKTALCPEQPVRLMEFCGSHTAAILRYGIRQLLPPGIELLSGPGCPVCVTDQSDIDRALYLARVPGVIMATFGDMLKVPGSQGSLAEARAEGADVRVAYSTMDALQLARENPSRRIIFLGVGFETTAPTIAASVAQAAEQNIGNYAVFSLAKICPPVIKALLDGGEVRLHGLICPGHVSAIIGTEPYEFIARDHAVACVVAGFEPVDILQAITMLLTQLREARPRVEVAYTRGVMPIGNLHALNLMSQIFETSAVSWRGMGEVPASGLKLRAKYAAHDAERLYDIPPIPAHEATGCICGEILRGVKTPADCSLFGLACTPAHPIGPCMVSGEGACGAYHSYGDGRGG